VRKGLSLAASLLVVIALLMGGCVRNSGHPEGMKSLRWLTDDEKDKVIEIALSSPKALYYKTGYSRYEVELQWIGVTWENSEPSSIGIVEYEWMDEATELFQEEEAVFPGVRIYFGELPELSLDVAVDLETETAIDLLALPCTPPTPRR